MEGADLTPRGRHSLFALVRGCPRCRTALELQRAGFEVIAVRRHTFDDDTDNVDGCLEARRGSGRHLGKEHEWQARQDDPSTERGDGLTLGHAIWQLLGSFPLLPHAEVAVLALSPLLCKDHGFRTATTEACQRAEATEAERRTAFGWRELSR